MSGETDLPRLLKELNPQLNTGEYVFATTKNLDDIPRENTICEFREVEGITVIVEKTLADRLSLHYSYVSHWITLKVHSSLNAVGLTATVANVLMKNGISCNVVAGYYHDHLFVKKRHSKKAIQILTRLSSSFG